MYERDTIAAIATPPGQGGVAIIRVSGPDAETTVRHVFVPVQPHECLLSHHLYLGRIIDPLTGQSLDQGLLTLMRAPRSYTGEDVAEIHCHGGGWLSRRILAAVLSQGARLASPGEFTKRAFLNGRLDLSQAEAILDLIQAQSEPGLHLAWEQLSGRLSETCTTIRERLLGLTAYVEAFIDFPEEDIPKRAQVELEQDTAALTEEIAALGATFTQGKVYREGMRTAIIGKPNVGKSSLLNLLAGTDRAIVTPVPGTTRDVLEETVVVSGVPLVVWDTAGLRSTTTDEVERIGVERARAEVREAELVLAVFDASRPLDAEDELVCAEVAGKKVIPVLNKVDLPFAVNLVNLATRLHSGPLVHLSAKCGIGLEDLEKRIQETALGTGLTYAQEQIEGVIVSRARHRDALAKAEQSLRQVSAGLQAGLPLDLVVIDLRAALDHIGEIAGHVSTEDILDRVFREFCIGK
ncbi:MAG: tRNA uridine-5-carboxymethylaminomethyl(34) synthesis GTPase MnmE [Deltaproteobacteria bacterium]|nr:tRNA uridine-5-carboxymethylaminomethyl(34) synthesis GTPase MnmE [Deltaproteobacteria bacterium]